MKLKAVRLATAPGSLTSLPGRCLPGSQPASELRIPETAEPEPSPAVTLLHIVIRSPDLIRMSFYFLSLMCPGKHVFNLF